MKFSTTEEEVAYISQKFTEWAATSNLHVSYSENEFPYKWKIKSDDPLGYRGTISIDASEVMQMQVMSEDIQRKFLYSKFLQALIVPAT
jgi:hypothetical protein